MTALIAACLIFIAPAPADTGACCVDGSCTQTTEAECDALGGLYYGNDSTCDEIACGGIGACCFLKEYCHWECLEETQQQCSLRYASTWHGTGTRCEDIQCPPCVGACCLNDDTCVLTAQTLCELQDGVFWDFDLCHQIQCEPCIGDINGDHVVNILDLLVMLNAWGPCP